ncbi:MAG TPA: hypothetical protein DCS67_10520, partial [Clostridiales bacterium UBA8960]|nr:hypothetical protein [Clostridiales bacterium UBA8960]
KLVKGELDLAIINIMPGNSYDGLELYPFTTLEHIFISKNPVHHKSISLTDLSKSPLVCLEQNSTTRRVLDRFFDANGINWTPAFEFGSFDVILEAVSASMGIGFVPKKIAKKHLDEGTFIEVDVTVNMPSIEIGILINKSKPLSLAAQKYLDILKNTEV